MMEAKSSQQKQNFQDELGIHHPQVTLDTWKIITLR